VAAASRGFAWHIGKDYFDYNFEKKLDRGNYPHDHKNFTRILDEEVDKNCEIYQSNYDAMRDMNIELEERVAEAMLISKRETEKLAERDKRTLR